MNERIEALKKLATKEAQGWYVLDADMFAQLIVQECADIALREEHDPYECIKKHFGVK